MNKKRERAILEILLREKSTTVSSLAKRLYASEPSIRRDLNSLESQHFIRRNHGGAVLDETSVSKIKIPFLLREMENSDEKIRIAKKAVQLVKPGDVVFLDASTSTFRMIPYLAEIKDITVITNGIKALAALSERNINCIGTGGTVVNSCLAFYGDAAYEVIRNYNADIFFFSIRGLDLDGNLSDISEKDNGIRKKMMAQSAESYLLCTSKRIDKKFMHNLCNVSELSGIVTSDALPKCIAKRCKKII